MTTDHLFPALRDRDPGEQAPATRRSSTPQRPLTDDDDPIVVGFGPSEYRGGAVCGIPLDPDPRSILLTSAGHVTGDIYTIPDWEPIRFAHRPYNESPVLLTAAEVAALVEEAT